MLVARYNPNGTIDKKRCKELIDKARPLKVTCHRAFDMTRDPYEALEDCIEVGFERILTAGQQAKASLGVDLIAGLVKRARGRIKIMPGSGIHEDSIQEIISKTGVEEVHFSALAFKDSGMEFRNPAIAAMGSNEGSEFKLRTVDPDRVRRIRKLAEFKI